jgi:cyclophilin family peptidyl-prolyl cis-trans isomerase
MLKSTYRKEKTVCKEISMSSFRRMGMLFCLFGIAFPFMSYSQSIQTANPPANLHPVVLMSTNMGQITITLDAEKAPLTVKNFLAYVETGFYDSTLVHRVMPGFIIQGGAFEAGTFMQKATNPPVKNESPNGLSNIRGSVAMALGATANSATSEFFINLAGNSALDQDRYTVFGQVTAGMDTVDKIAKVPTGTRGPMENVPVKKVVIESISVGK